MGLTAGGFRLPAFLYALCQDPYISDTSVFRVSDIDLASMDLPGSLPVSAPCSVSEAPCAPLSLNPPCDLPSGPALHRLYACPNIALANCTDDRRKQEEECSSSTQQALAAHSPARSQPACAALACLCARAGAEMQRAQKEGNKQGEKQAKSSGLFFRVALVVVATGAYVEYVQLFALSASRLFIPDHQVCVRRVSSYV